MAASSMPSWPSTLLTISFDGDINELGPGFQQLVPDWSMSQRVDVADVETHLGPRLGGARPARAVLGWCNSTHGIVYLAGGGQFEADYYVRHAHLGSSPWPEVPHGQRNRTNFLHFVEAPAHFEGPPLAHGYQGFVANTREATIWRPLITLANVHEAVRGLAFNPSRDTIGIWTDHCYPHTRRGLISELVASNMPVRSFGRCRHNTGLLGTPSHHTMYSRLERPEDDCRSNRIIVAIENNNCVDWVSDNLLAALRCGAIPLLYQINGLPDYASLYGPFPHINASRLGWQQEVEQVMRNDSYYHELLHRYKKLQRAASATSAAISASAGGATTRAPSTSIAHGDGSYHCAWYDKAVRTTRQCHPLLTSDCP